MKQLSVKNWKEERGYLRDELQRRFFEEHRRRHKGRFVEDFRFFENGGDYVSHVRRRALNLRVGRAVVFKNVFVDGDVYRAAHRFDFVCIHNRKYSYQLSA